MNIPRFFWFCAAVAVLIGIISFSYYLLVDIPQEQRHKYDLESQERAKLEATRQEAACAEQARKTADDFARRSSGFGPPPNVTGSSNHYNRKLGKCFVDIDAVDKNSIGEFLMNAYEQSNVLWCNTFIDSKSGQPIRRICMDGFSRKPLNPEEADNQIDQYLRE